jgi:hypothetical protein
MEECQICERIKDVKRIGSNRNNITFKIALVEDSTRDKIFHGRLTHRAVRFNFCPICGKKYSKSSLYVRADRVEGEKEE